MNFFEHAPFTQDFSVQDGYIMVPEGLGHGVVFTDTAKKLYAA